MFFPGKILSFKLQLCCSWFFSHSVSSFPLHALTSFIKHSGIPCGIKIADGHSGSDRQDLPLEDSNSNCFSPLVSETPREKRFGRTKMLLKIRHTSDRMPLPSWFALHHQSLWQMWLQFASSFKSSCNGTCPRFMPKGEGGRRAQAFPCVTRAALPAEPRLPRGCSNHPRQLLRQEHRPERGLKLADRNESYRGDKEPKETLTP